MFFFESVVWGKKLLQNKREPIEAKLGSRNPDVALFSIDLEADGRKEIPTGGQRDRFGNDVQYVCSTAGTHVSAHQVE